MAAQYVAAVTAFGIAFDTGALIRSERLIFCV
jgi:hypothetical protein